MTIATDRILQTAWNFYNEGNFSEALKLAITAANQTENPRYSLHLACRCLLESQRYDDVLTFLEQIHRAETHAASVFLGTMNAYLLDDRFDLLHRIYNALPETHIAGLLALYHSACAHIGQGDLPAGLEKAVLFRDRCKAFWHLMPFIEDDALNVVYRQTVSLGTSEEVVARQPFASITTPAVGSIQWHTDIPVQIDEPVVHFASADTAYLRGFSRHLLGSLNAVGGPVRVHLNVMRPDETIVEELLTIGASLPSVTLDVSTAQTRNTEPSVFACGRFYVLPELIKRYQLPIITVDADSHVTPKVRHLSEMPKSFDIGFFRTKKVTPASMIDCAVFVTCPTDLALTFLERFLAYVDPLLDGQHRLTWLVDQAAIFTLWVYYNETSEHSQNERVRLVDLRSVSGIADLYDIVPNSVQEDNKDSIKISNSASAFFHRQQSNSKSDTLGTGDS